MEYIKGSTDFQLKNSTVTLGKFDGLHLGHQYLIEQVISMKKAGFTAVMFTFLYHPGNLISEREFQLIYTEEEKYRKLSETGMDILVSYPFTKETKKLEPEDFIEEILVKRLDAKIIVVGDDFRFGHNRRGDIPMLQKYEERYGYKVLAYGKKRWKDTVISSSVIRDELKKGNMEAVNSMLGQPYSILGKVMHGRKIGRTLGMPTTNILPPVSKLLPPCGVYASKTLVDGSYYAGVTNIGYKPTVGAEKSKGVETFLFGFDRDLYGKEIKVELYDYHRPELKFKSVDELKAVMITDIEYARKYFGTV